MLCFGLQSLCLAFGTWHNIKGDFTKKKILSLILAICLIIPCSLFLTACGSKKLSNDSGFKLEGGGFEKGSVLVTDKLENTSEDAGKVYDKLEGFGVGVSDKSKAFIYDIYVSKDDKKVQPNGKVKITAKVEKNDKGYKVYHIKDDDTIEELEATYDDGKLIFETESFSYYVFIAADAINPIATAGSEAEWNKAINYWQAQNNVKVVERTTSSHDDELGAQIMIYQLDGTAFNEDGYYEDAEESKDKGKGYYIVKETGGYFRYESYDGVTWYKNSTGDMTNQLKRTIYGCLDLENELIDFSFSKFTYDASSKTYKYNNNNNITVKLEFNGSNVDKIIITSYRESDNTTFVRTITFGDAEVEVPKDVKDSY